MASLEFEEKLRVLRDRGRPVNILVIGPIGSGKSTLVNAMLGKDVAEVGHGAISVTIGTHPYEGEYQSVGIKVYDTAGFGNIDGVNDRNSLLDNAKRGQFNLILICTKLGVIVDQDMFSELASVLREEMWKRTVIILTFANQFITNQSVNSNDLEGEVRGQLDEYNECIVGFLSHHIKREVLEGMPFCIAGVEDERRLPTTDDWLNTLWDKCIIRCRYHEQRPLRAVSTLCLQLLFIGIFIVGGGAGAVIGAIFGSIVPFFGTVIGAIAGGCIGIALAKRCVEKIKNYFTNTFLNF